MALRCRYYNVLIAFVVCSVLCLPLALFFSFTKDKPLLGRIAILKEARGKRRLIGVTD